jgi:ribosomal protein S18 acetylase RimI-like enzyme
MAFRVRELHRGELDALLTCFQAAFGIDTASIAIVRNSLVNDPYFRPERVRVGVLDGQIVSHVVILHRAAYVGNQVVTVAGITGVATHPEYQRRGFGTRVMDDALRVIRHRGYHLAMLHTRVPGFFVRLGFIEVPQIMGFECPAAAVARMAVEAGPYTLDKIDYNRHWPALAAIYHQYSTGRTGMQVRDMRYWETWPRRGTFPSGFTYQLDALGLVALAAGQMVAYLASHSPSDQPHLTISEIAHLQGHERAGLVLLQRAVEAFLEKSRGRVILHVGGNAPVLALLEAEHVPLEVEVGPGLMVLVPNREWVRPAGFRSVDDAIEHLFRSEPPIRWHRDGY